LPPVNRAQRIRRRRNSVLQFRHLQTIVEALRARHLMNRGFNLADAIGKAVAAGNQPYSFTAIISGERHPRVFTFSITGMQAGVLP
jgi:hypothetical protein